MFYCTQLGSPRPCCGGLHFFFSQPEAGLTNQVLVRDSWAGTPLTLAVHFCMTHGQEKGVWLPKYCNCTQAGSWHQNAMHLSLMYLEWMIWVILWLYAPTGAGKTAIQHFFLLRRGNIKMLSGDFSSLITISNIKPYIHLLRASFQVLWTFPLRSSLVKKNFILIFQVFALKCIGTTLKPPIYDEWVQQQHVAASA